MNGPVVILLLAAIGLIIYGTGRWYSRQMDHWRDDIERANRQRDRARAEYERRHPSHRDQG